MEGWALLSLCLCLLWLSSSLAEKIVVRHGNGTLSCHRHIDIYHLREIEMEVFRYKDTTLSPREHVFFFRQLLKANFYFEFGCTRATAFACDYFPDLEIRCIDSNVVQINTLHHHPCVNSSMEDGRLVMHYINIGEVNSDGKPLGYERIKHWGEYSESVRKVSNLADFVYINSHFRIASALKTILYSTNPKLMLVIHDFFQTMDYQVVLKFARIVDCSEKLVLLKVKPVIDKNDLLKDINAYFRNV
jgi:hypothetical protein